jgi:hypothetical protein
MTAAVLLGLGAALSVLTIWLRRARLARRLPTGLVVLPVILFVAAAGLATALGSELTGRWHAVFVVVGLAAAGIGGNAVTTAVFDAVDEGHDPDADPAPSPSGASPSVTDTAPTSLRSAGQVLRGGAWIGILERLAIFAALVGRWPEGIAVVLAVKGLGRYPELRAAHRPGLAERFIIGTLVSVLWAGLCAYAATGPALG